MNSSSLLALFSIMSLMELMFLRISKGIVEPEVLNLSFKSLILFSVALEMIPRLPVLHNADEFEFIMGLHYEFFDKSSSDIVFNVTDTAMLIYDLHPIACKLLRQKFITIFVW